MVCPWNHNLCQCTYARLMLLLGGFICLLFFWLAVVGVSGGGGEKIEMKVNDVCGDYGLAMKIIQEYRILKRGS